MPLKWSSSSSPRMFATSISRGAELDSLREFGRMAARSTVDGGQAEDKVIHALVGRIVNKLPCNSGRRLAMMEADAAVQATVQSLLKISKIRLGLVVHALTSALETLSKHISGTSLVEGPLDVLHSQLFLLHLLFSCLSASWQLQAQLNTLATELPRAWPSPEPLDDALARYLLAVILACIRMLPPETSTAVRTSSPATNRDAKGSTSSTSLAGRSMFSASASTSKPLGGSFMQQHSYPSATTFRSTPPLRSKMLSPSALDPLTTVLQMTKYIARTTFFLSASNWPLAFQRAKSRIKQLTAVNEEALDLVDLRILEWSALDRAKLAQILQEVSPVFLHIKPAGQLALAKVLRHAIWNWIDANPGEYEALVESNGRLDPGTDILIDSIQSMSDSTSSSSSNVTRVKAFFPLMASLLVISPETLKRLVKDGGGSKGSSTLGRKQAFLDSLRKGLSSHRAFEACVNCYLDFLKGASCLTPRLTNAGIRMLAVDTYNSLKSALLGLSSASEISDPQILVDVLTTLSQVNPSDAFQFIFPKLLASPSDVSKGVAVRACMATVLEGNRLPWSPSIQVLRDELAPILRAVFRACSGDSLLGRDRGPRSTPEPPMKHIELICHLLKLFSTDPLFIYTKPDTDAATTNKKRAFLETISCLMVEPTPKAVRTAASKSLTGILEKLPRLAVSSSQAQNVFSQSGPALWRVLLDAGRQALFALHVGEPDDVEQSVSVLRIIALELGHLAEATPHHLADMPEGTIAISVASTAFLISLSWPDVEQGTLASPSLIALAALMRLAHRSQLTGVVAPENDEARDAVRLVNGRIQALESIANLPSATGRHQQQRALRKTIRPFIRPSIVPTACWLGLAAYCRGLTARILAADGDQNERDSRRRALAADIDGLDEEESKNWQNIVLLLCTTANSVIYDGGRPPALSSLIGENMLPKVYDDSNDPLVAFEAFLHECVDLLICHSVHVRETVKDALGQELPPNAYPMLIPQMTQLLSHAVGPTGMMLSDPFTIFVEQAILVLRLAISRPQDGEYSGSTHLELGELYSLLVQYVQKLGQDDVSLRIKLAFCQLTEGGLQKAELVTLVNGVAQQNIVLELLLGWSSYTVSETDSHRYRADVGSKLQHELDHASLRAMVPLTEGLTLRSAGDDSEDSIVKSRVFYRYLHHFMQMLDRSETNDALSIDTPSLDSGLGRQKTRSDVDTSALAVSILSHLLAANIDVGLKHCLLLAYHEKPALRIALMQLLTNILRQGARFGGLSTRRSGLTPRPYLELFNDHNLAFALAVTEVCPSNEIDEISVLVFRSHEANGQLLPLMRALLQREVSNTNHEADLFRSNSITTRIISTFGRTYGYNYCRSTLQPLLNSLLEKPTDCSFELDPSKAGPNDDIERNADHLRLMCQGLLDLICASSSRVPVMIRALCNIIWEVVETRYPESRHSAVGSFIFLRFFCSSIVSPETIDLEVPSDVREIRRALLLIAKVIQSLANNVTFGGREVHMSVLNSFLSENIRQVTEYLSELAAKPSTSELQRAVRGYQDEAQRMQDPEVDDTILQRFAFRHISKLDAILTSMPARYHPVKGVQMGRPANDGILVLEQLKAKMATSGPPSVVAKLSAAARSQVYDDFMKQYRGRNVESVSAAFYEGPISQNERRIFYFVVSRTALVDYDLLTYHIFHLLDNVTGYFDLVVDLTEVSASNELPLTWLKRTLQMCPSGTLSCVNTLALYNPNSHTKRRIRRVISGVSPIVPSIGRNVVAASSPAELADAIPFTSPALPEFTMALAYEADHVFTNLLTLSDHDQQIPVVAKIGYDCLQVASWRKQDFTTTVKAYLIDVIRLKDIEDISTGTGATSDQLTIRYSQNETLTFITRKRDDMAQIIRSARAKIHEAPSFARTLRSSDIPGTLLSVALLNLCSSDEVLRSGAYALLQELCHFFKFDLASRMMLVGAGIHIPSNSLGLVADISKALASLVPRLTLDFLKEWLIGFSKADIPQKTAALFYVSSWLSHLSGYAKPSKDHGLLHAKTVAEILRGLINITVSEKHQLYLSIHEWIWKPLGKSQDALLDLMLSELLSVALDSGMSSEKTKCVADILVSIASIPVRGKVIARLRKLLAQTYLRPSPSLVDNLAWPDICTLTRLNAALAFNSTSPLDTQLFLPELFHIITSLTGIGSVGMRQLVYGLLVNVVQSLAVSPPSTETDGPALLALLAQCQSPELTSCFGLRRVAGGLDLASLPHPGDGDALLHNTEQVANLLGEILDAAAVSTDCGNAWRARWMGLVTATCFQHNPATQPQAFTVMGFLAREDVDEDLVYQILVAMSTTLSQFTEADNTLVISMLRCLSRIIPGLLPDSRYAPSLFWIAVGVLQLGHVPLFAGALQVMLMALRSMIATRLPGQDVLQALSEAKTIGGEAGRKLDEVCGVSFDTDLGFALVGIIFKGVRHPANKALAVEVMFELLKISAAQKSSGGSGDAVGKLVKTSSVPFFMALLPIVAGSATDFGELVSAAGLRLDEKVLADPLSCPTYEVLDLPDNYTALLLVTFVTTVLNSATSDPERIVLYRFIADAAGDMPEVISMASDSLVPRMSAVLGTTTTVPILDSITRILERGIFPGPALGPAASGSASQNSTRHRRGNGSISSMPSLPSMTGVSGSGAREAFLEEMGMTGLTELGFPSPKMDRVAPMAKWVAASIEAFMT